LSFTLANNNKMKLITLATYDRLAEAQRDADRLGSKGISASIVQGGSAVIAGTGSTIELQIEYTDLDKLNELEAEIQAEIEADRPYQCPNCDSKNYTESQSFASTVASMFRGIARRRSMFDGVLRFKCRDCNTYFKIRI